MPRWASWLPLGLAAAALLTGCGSPLDTSDLVKVEMSSFQSLPPPHGSAQAVLTSAESLATFRREMTAYHVGQTSQTVSADGCTGGKLYTVVLDRGGGKQATTLNAYDCGGQITGNISGDVAGFLAYVDTQLVATPPIEG